MMRFGWRGAIFAIDLTPLVARAPVPVGAKRSRRARRAASSLVLTLLGAAALLALTPRSSRAQEGATTVTGTVRDTAAGPIRDVQVLASDGGVTMTDSLGRFALYGLRGDSVRLTLRRLGYEPRDTTIALRRGGRVRVDMVLRVPQWIVEARRSVAEAQAHDEIEGRVDSSALGLIARDTAASLPFGSFGARLLAAAVRERGPDSNTVASPVSAGMALSLAFLGARGATAEALSGALGTAALDRAELVRRGAAFTAAAADRRDVRLEIAHALWVDSVARLVPAFEASAAAWRAPVGTLRLASRDAVETINAWADSVTHGRIPTILDEPGSDTSRLFIASSVYFKGKWLEPFDKDGTRPRDFTLRSGRKVSIPMMARTGQMAYAREPGYQMVRLPYRGGRVPMYVILPDSAEPGNPEGSGALLQRFSEHGWPPSLSEAQMRDVELVLPKLHVELELDLAPVLESLGAGIALGGNADFRDLAVDRATGQELPLFIEKALQRVYLDVDEEGTEAAAVTGMMMAQIVSVPPPPVPFVVDRPFLFVLRDEGSGSDLFVGSIQRP